MRNDTFQERQMQPYGVGLERRHSAHLGYDAAPVHGCHVGAQGSCDLSSLGRWWFDLHGQPRQDDKDLEQRWCECLWRCHSEFVSCLLMLHSRESLFERWMGMRIGSTRWRFLSTMLSVPDHLTILVASRKMKSRVSVAMMFTGPCKCILIVG